ncbi:MAG: hypothetical protein ACREDA_12535, partial [Methylocella sp.]
TLLTPKFHFIGAPANGIPWTFWCIMPYQENGGRFCGPLALRKQVVSAALLLGLLRGCDERTIHPAETSPGATGAEAIGIAVVVVLALGYLGFMEFKNVLVGPKSGGYVNIGAIVGDWQAAGRPWHIVFRTDKTIGMSSAGSAGPGNMEPGTFRLWTEGNVLINMKNGRDFTATFRALTPNQFDLVDSKNGAVTVFARAP